MTMYECPSSLDNRVNILFKKKVLCDRMFRFMSVGTRILNYLRNVALFFLLLIHA